MLRCEASQLSMPILPNADTAIIDERKIRDYVLNPDHPSGGNKARALRAATGLTPQHWVSLIEQIKHAILVEDAEPTDPIPYGRRFRVVMTVTGPNGSLRIRTGWIYRTGEDVPRLATLYPLD
jgi:filamentous hemagglutinin